MKSKIMSMMLVAALALASFGLMGCEESVKDADGNVYPAAKIGNQIWMAKNLNVNVPGSMCYNNDPANCERYGRLYTWEAAKSACPSGWHLPSMEEFKSLLDYMGPDNSEWSRNLRASSWDEGLDKYGFSALPAGRYDSESFVRLGNGANFWSSEGRSGYNSLIFSKSGGLGDRKRAKRAFDDNFGCGGGPRGPPRNPP